MSPSPEVLTQATDPAFFESLAPPLQISLFLGALVFLAAALVSMTSFTRIIIVLSFVRRALTTQEIPPNPVVIGLSLFLTYFVMGPTIERMHESAITPYLSEELTASETLAACTDELKVFMLGQTRERDIGLFLHMAGIDSLETMSETPMRVLVPAFVISELKTAFMMGFCIYVPFLLIDLVVSAVLMSMGMMMMPPVVISTPFKILLFVLVDGWHLVAYALNLSFT